MTKFKTGDVVRRVNGVAFSDGRMYATVDRVEDSKFNNAPMIWLKETGTHISPESLLMTYDSEFSGTIRALEEKRSEYLAEMEKLSKKADELTQAIKTIEKYKEDK